MCENHNTNKLKCNRCSNLVRIIKNVFQDEHNFFCSICKKSKNQKKEKTTYLEPVFNCTSCNKLRNHDTREKGRNRCSICSGYRKHSRVVGSLSFQEFENNYFLKKDMQTGLKNKCNMCLTIKDSNQFKNSYRGLCRECWYTDDQIIIRRTRKILRVPIRNRNRGVDLFNRTFSYSFNDFRVHIESLFTDGMSWDLVVSKHIHIDHIIPASAFNHSNHKHFELCWSLNNLQPLWAADNQAKHDKLINGQRVQDIRRNKNHRELIDRLLNDLYGVDLS